MAEEFSMTKDIVEENKLRMLHLRNYYPFFKIMETSFTQYREGKYAQLDMGYMILAILRFFMEENSFKNKEVTYPEYEAFMERLLEKDFRLKAEAAEKKELISFIFDKLVNDGKPFLFPYYEPSKFKQMVMRIRLLTSRIEEQVIYYSITAEAIEFYLDTKEFKDRSSITIEQLLLEKMIQSRNFRGGIEVVRRINSEVGKLQAKKNEVLGILSFDVFEGMKAYEEFMDSGMKWFDEEQKLFEKNEKLIRYALEKAQMDERRGEYQSRYYKSMEEIFLLEQEMRRAMVRHGELLQACTDLQKKADELVSQSKLHMLRSSFDFRGMLQSFMEQDRADKLEYFAAPLFKLNIRKTFSLRMMDEMLTFRPEKEDAGEQILRREQEEYVYEDEVEESRIEHNFQVIWNILLACLMERKVMTLGELCEKEFAEERMLNNLDFYTFFVHFSQKKEYDFKEVYINPDTFLEESLSEFLRMDGNEKYRGMKISLEMLPQSEVKLGDVASVTDMKILFSAVF